MARHAVQWTVSVDSKLLREFRRVCKERGRTQSFYVNGMFKRVIEGVENGEVLRVPQGVKPKRGRAKLAK